MNLIELPYRILTLTTSYIFILHAPHLYNILQTNKIKTTDWQSTTKLGCQIISANSAENAKRNVLYCQTGSKKSQISTGTLMLSSIGVYSTHNLPVIFKIFMTANPKPCNLSLKAVDSRPNPWVSNSQPQCLNSKFSTSQFNSPNL